MANRLIECVPNFSEGRDLSIIKEITDAIESVASVKLLNVDPGADTNRTVVTFVGEPESVVEAAFRAVRRASQLIDMRHHHGEHPRIGATDVLPLIPVSGITMEQTAKLARDLAARVGNELGIPVYCYEQSATTPQRRNLAVCRSGEYEGLKSKLADPNWKPDFGSSTYNDIAERSGATVIGARDFLVAVNYNLNTTSTRRANAIAFDVREKGRVKREGDLVTGKIVRDEKGEPVMIPGTLPSTKAIGWYIAEYGIAQVSMNITDITVTPLHVAWEEVVRKAYERGIVVTGTEIVGLLPKSVLVDAGEYFLRKQCRSIGVSEQEKIRIAIKTMGLSELAPFDPKQKVIEYLIADQSDSPLIEMSCKAFALETASESSAPGGGSISAYMGALGAALGTMVANLSAHKAGWDSRWEEFSDCAQKGHHVMEHLLALVDEDTAAFNKIMEALSMPKESEQQKTLRNEALQNATIYAAQVPLRTMEQSFSAFEVVRAMALNGNPNSVSDAGVGALALRSAIMGAELNVRINASGIKDSAIARELTERATTIKIAAQLEEQQILEIVNSKIV